MCAPDCPLQVPSWHENLVLLGVQVSLKFGERFLSLEATGLRISWVSCGRIQDFGGKIGRCVRAEPLQCLACGEPSPLAGSGAQWVRLIDICGRSIFEAPASRSAEVAN